MRILHTTFALGCGGIETFLVSLANSQCEAGHDVEICTISTAGDSEMARGRLNPDIRQLSAGKHDLISGFKAIGRMAEIIRRGNYDIVHIHGQFYYYFLSVLRAPSHTRFVYTVHNDAAKENSRWDKLFTGVKKHWFRSGRLNAVTISTSSQTSFAEYYGKSTPSTLIPNGIVPVHCKSDSPDPLAQWRISEKTKVFVNPGRIYVQKNQIELCRAFSMLLSGDNPPDIQLIIAGPPEDHTILAAMQQFFSDRIRYIGQQTDLPVMLSAADAMIMPSLWEGMPIALLESIGSQCIPICTRAGGMADIIDCGCGIPIELASAQDIAKAVMEFCNTPEDKKIQMRKTCTEVFANYGIEACADKYMSLYTALSM